MSHFDAFKFPSSEVVQFRALVTPCMPSCEPVQCDQEESTGELRSVISFGKRRRRRSTTTQSARDDLLLVQSIQITDKFGFQRSDKLYDNSSNHESMSRDNIYGVDAEDIVNLNARYGGVCVNITEAIIAATLFIVAQIIVIAAWTFTWQRRKQILKHQEALSVSVSLPAAMHAGMQNRADSLCKLYDTGYSRRF